MKKFCEEMIEVIGVSKIFPSSSKNFKQFQIQDTFILPVENAGIKCILRVSHKININERYLIETSLATSVEHQNLTGKKVMVEGELIQKIEYVANDTTESVKAAHSIVPFSTFVVLEKDFDINSDIAVTPYIEDIFAKQINEGTVLMNTLVLLDVKDSNWI